VVLLRRLGIPVLEARDGQEDTTLWVKLKSSERRTPVIEEMRWRS
jgi:hypothetical protein